MRIILSTLVIVSLAGMTTGCELFKKSETKTEQELGKDSVMDALESVKNMDSEQSIQTESLEPQDMDTKSMGAGDSSTEPATGSKEIKSEESSDQEIKKDDSATAE